MITLESNKQKNLSFDLEVSGSANLPEVRLVLMAEGKNGLIFRGKMHESGAVKVSIPALDPVMGMLREKELTLKLETIVDNQWNEIWEDNNIRIKEPVSVKATSPVLEDKDEEVGIKVNSVKDDDAEPKSKKPKFDISPEDETTGEKNESAKSKTSLKSMFLNEDDKE